MHSEDCSASSLAERGRTRATTRTFWEVVDAGAVEARGFVEWVEGARGAVMGRLFGGLKEKEEREASMVDADPSDGRDIV